MTIKECIDTVYAVKPHEYTEVDQVRWLSFVEKIIIDEVIKTHEGYDGRYDEFTEYSPDNTSVELIVPAPHDRLYVAFLTMKIDELNNEIERFNNSRLLYNSYMLEYRKYYNKTHMPLSITSNKPHRPIKPQIGLSEAEFENLQRSLYYQLSEDFSKMTSQDRLNEIISSYLMNNVAVFKGKDGRDGIDGKDGVDGTVEFASLTPLQKLSLKGDKGDKGEKGENGNDGKDGKDGDVTSEYVNNNFSNALKGTAVGTNAVRIDDVSPVSHQINVSLEAVNLINQEEFFASSDTYLITAEVGKTYVFSYIPKEGATREQSIGEVDENGSLYSYNFENNSVTITIKDGCQYTWDFSEENPSDKYESVSMVLADVSGVKVKSYGKNLFDENILIEYGAEVKDGAYYFVNSNGAIYKQKIWENTNGITTPLTIQFSIYYDSETYQGYIFQGVCKDGTTISLGTLTLGEWVKKTVTVPEGKVLDYIWCSTRGTSSVSVYVKEFQVEVNETNSEYETYKEPVEGAVSVHPTTTLVADTNGVNIIAEYSRDINNAFAELEKAIANL